MKRFLCALLAVGMLLTLAACQPNGPETPATEERPLTFGLISERRYESRFLELGCELDESWTVASIERIREMNKITADMTEEQLAQRIESAEYLYDLMAIHKNNTDNVTIELKKGSILQMTMKDQDMANSYVLSIEEGLKEIGFKEVTNEVVPVTLADAQLYGVKTVATYEKTTIHQLTVPWRRGNYIATITIMAVKEETVEAVKDAFFPVKVS